MLWRPGDPSDSFYIVVNGRLRAIDDKEEGKVKILGWSNVSDIKNLTDCWHSIGEYGQGDPVTHIFFLTPYYFTNKTLAGRRT